MPAIQDVSLVDKFLMLRMSDGATVTHRLESIYLSCTCPQVPCEHVNYLYNVLEKVPERSFGELLKLKSNNPDLEITSKQFQDLQGAAARAYNIMNEVFRGKRTGLLGWEGRVPGVETILRVIQNADNTFDVSIKQDDRYEFQIVARIKPSPVYLDVHVCGCKQFEEDALCVHIRAFDEARISWTKNGLLSDGSGIKPLYRTGNGNIYTSRAKALEDIPEGAPVRLTLTDNGWRAVRIEDQKPDPYKFTWNQYERGTTAVDPAGASDETMFKMITRFGWGALTNAVMTSDGIELPVDGNIVKSRRPIDPKIEEPKEPPKPPSRFGDLEI